MKVFIKKIWLCLLIGLLCIGGYFISLAVLRQKMVSKQVEYISTAAAEVDMVWGLMSGAVPQPDQLPADSYQKDDLVYTKLNRTNNTFHTTLTLPAGTNIYYWMVQRKDTSGTATEIWDSGGNNQFFNLDFRYTGFFNPGYFIFLAGFLPLVLYYVRNKRPYKTSDHLFKIPDYIPQFDALRAIAVLLVVIHHWLPETSVFNLLSNGRIGVNVFFVLSGFLITRILLKAKKKTDTGQLKKGSAFKTFYIRRTLRIFPIYYLLLFIFLFFRIPPIQEGTPFYFTYTANYFFYDGQYFPARLSHLWSLAVEEQFYLLWPWLVILVNRKFLPYLIALFFIIGVSSNYIFTANNWRVEILTPACFDAFAVGASLAYLVAYRQNIIEKIRPHFRLVFLLISALFLLDAFKYSFLPSRTTHALLTAAVIFYCLFKNNNRFVNYILEHPWLHFIGKISYGVYLYHLFVPELWLWINEKFYSWGVDPFFNQSVPAGVQPLWLFVQQFAFLLLLCVLSWRLIEKPVNNLKDRFAYKKENQKETLKEIKPEVVSF